MSGIQTRGGATLVVLAVGAMGLAASPAALAHDRGGPGQPGIQQAPTNATQTLPPLKAPRLVSWTD